MPGPVDDALKHMTELSPQEWLVHGGWRAAPVRLIDPDIATVTGAADKVLRVAGSPDWLLAVDFHSGHDAAQLLPRLLLYNAALGKRHGLQVRTLVVVLHPGADSPQLTGLYERGFPGEPPDVMLRYRVLRVWQVPAEQWLSGGVGMVPLAPLGDVQEAQLPAIIDRMKQRLDRELTQRETYDLWVATNFLMETCYSQTLIDALLQGVVNMEESVLYQKIIHKGKAEEARTMLLVIGRPRLGEPPTEAVAALQALSDVSQLEELGARLMQVSSWQELLGLPGPRRRGRGRRKTT
jgi:hypothetical protein